MLTHEENETLCRVGPNTKMGRVMRRYWHPIAASEQLPAPDCDPLRVSLLGETFVAFRNTEGRVGILNELCMHRGASLALGRTENNGIRCLYHGWKFGVDGTIQETPNHPDPRVRERMKAPCYPVREEGGMIWTYIGDKKKVPPFRRFSFMDAKAANRTVLRANVDCNYLQLWEGGCDSSHVGILHSNVARPGWLEETFVRNADADNPANLAVADNAPTLEIEDTDYGFHYAAMRRGPGPDGKPEVKNIRVVPAIMPYGRIIPAPSFFFHVFEVPENDVRTSTYIVAHGYAPVDRAKLIALLGLDDPRYWNPQTCDFNAGWVNRFGQNREAMKQDWSGLGGVEKEDAIMGLSMGPIFDRTLEHLVAADQAVVRLRRRLLDSVKLVESGEEPLGAANEDLTGISCTSDAPIDRPWQGVGHHYELPPTAQAAE
jgi:phenylpropionate dioxygenase-like ring-hydroxylating dioxygenase large terminal subunit